MTSVEFRAGFTPGEKYDVARAKFPPPQELAGRIFHWVEDVEEQLAGRTDIPDPVTTKSFLALLKWGRECVLQVRKTDC